jgi:hypothetical protein
MRRRPQDILEEKVNIDINVGARRRLAVDTLRKKLFHIKEVVHREGRSGVRSQDEGVLKGSLPDQRIIAAATASGYVDWTGPAIIIPWTMVFTMHGSQSGGKRHVRRRRVVRIHPVSRDYILEQLGELETIAKIGLFDLGIAWVIVPQGEDDTVE